MRKTKTFKAFIATLGIAAALSAKAGTPIDTPSGFDDYCKTTNHVICDGRDKSKLQTIVKDGTNSFTSKPNLRAYSGTLKDLEDVNRYVNQSITYSADKNTDKWEISSNGLGDCEDYVLAKMDRLISLGWNSKDLRIGILKTKDGYHTVLVANLNGVLYTLDNGNRDIKKTTHLHDENMKWDRIQIPGTTRFETFNGKD